MSPLIRTPRDAEAAACDWMRLNGFPDAELTGLGVDSGVDVRARDAVAQVKAEVRKIGRPELQQLRGIAAVEGRTPLFFALGGYTDDALAWADSAGIAVFGFDLSGEVEPMNEAATRFAPAFSATPSVTGLGSCPSGWATVLMLLYQIAAANQNARLEARQTTVGFSLLLDTYWSVSFSVAPPAGLFGIHVRPSIPLSAVGRGYFGRSDEFPFAEIQEPHFLLGEFSSYTAQVSEPGEAVRRLSWLLAREGLTGDDFNLETITEDSGESGSCPKGWESALLEIQSITIGDENTTLNAHQSSTPLGTSWSVFPTDGDEYLVMVHPSPSLLGVGAEWKLQARFRDGDPFPFDEDQPVKGMGPMWSTLANGPSDVVRILSRVLAREGLTGDDFTLETVTESAAKAQEIARKGEPANFRNSTEIAKTFTSLYRSDHSAELTAEHRETPHSLISFRIEMIRLRPPLPWMINVNVTASALRGPALRRKGFEYRDSLETRTDRYHPVATSYSMWTMKLNYPMDIDTALRKAFSALRMTPDKFDFYLRDHGINTWPDDA